jgi:hypothetical protein
MALDTISIISVQLIVCSLGWDFTQQLQLTMAAPISSSSKSYGSCTTAQPELWPLSGPRCTPVQCELQHDVQGEGCWLPLQEAFAVS